LVKLKNPILTCSFSMNPSQASFFEFALTPPIGGFESFRKSEIYKAKTECFRIQIKKKLQTL
ncbi:unnamed protein product, partial [Arabidopsis halleri]